MTSLILVTAWPGQPSVDDLARAAAAGERPRKDYVEIAGKIDAEVVDGQYLGGLKGAGRALVRSGRIELAQAWAARSRRREVEHVVVWGDRLGLMVATLWRAGRIRTDLVLVSVLLSTPRKARFIRATGAVSGARLIVQYSTAQQAFARRELGIHSDRLAHLLQPVDLRFWTPGPQAEEDLICAVGTEARDYPVLIQAMRGLDARLEIAIGTMTKSPSDLGDGRLAPTMVGVPEADVPGNVTIRHHLTPVQLRDLYRRARIVVVPLRDVEFDAGVTAITEAMAMGKPVVVTQTRGQRDVVAHGTEGLLVPPGDPAALRGALAELLEDGEACSDLGASGRLSAARRHSLDDYSDAFAELVLRG